MTPSADRRSWLCDMDGVLISQGRMVEGADRFLGRLHETDSAFLVLTNNSLFTPREISYQLASLGLRVGEHQLWTSALATAKFVQDQRPGGSAFVIGETSMHEALFDVGYHEDDVAPDYVVLGETQHYSFEEFSTAIRLIERGSHFVATNYESTGPGPDGPLPGCGAMAGLIEAATGVAPYFVGKPNPVMIREALAILGAASGSTVMVGDRMETDILAGVEAGLETVLVLSGVASTSDAQGRPYRASRVVTSIADLIDDV